MWCDESHMAYWGNEFVWNFERRFFFLIAGTVVREKTWIEYIFCKGMRTPFLLKERSSSFLIFDKIQCPQRSFKTYYARNQMFCYICKKNNRFLWYHWESLFYAKSIVLFLYFYVCCLEQLAILVFSAFVCKQKVPALESAYEHHVFHAERSILYFHLFRNEIKATFFLSLFISSLTKS